MRFLVAAAAVLIGSIAVTGCDASNLDASNVPAGSPSLTLPVPSATSATAAPTRPTRPTSSAPTTTAPTQPSGTPTVTAVATNTANGSGTTAGIPTSYAAASSRLAALKSAPHRALDRFSTTGDVVYCVLRSSSIPTSCELRTGAIDDPGVCGQSMSDAVGRIQLGDDGAVPECNTDTIREPGAATVAAPAVVTSGSLECAVEKIGVTCVTTRTRAGFFLTPHRYATFS
ncbi:MAG TPA: hypothetical protein VJ872_00690 [Nocardioides sp.]|nr:hypothetical protein [Nocardioides sp.]